MIDEQTLRSILQTHTDLIYNLLEREENNKTSPDEKKLKLLQEYRQSLTNLVNESLIK
jgi:hypothetical protein